MACCAPSGPRDQEPMNNKILVSHSTRKKKLAKYEVCTLNKHNRTINIKMKAKACTNLAMPTTICIHCR